METGLVLSAEEESLVRHVSDGGVCNLADDGPVDEESMRSWGADHIIRASVIRDILLGRIASNPDPHGLRLRGAVVADCLDLENVTSAFSLELIDCFLPNGLVARDAELVALGLKGCRLTHPEKSALDAGRLTTPLLFLDNSSISAPHGASAANLSGAHITSQFSCSGAKLSCPAGVALAADAMQVDGVVFLDEGFVAEAGDGPAVRLTGAHIGSQFLCSGAKLSSSAGPALAADGLQVDHAMFLGEGFSAKGGGDSAAVRLTGARVVNRLEIAGAKLTSDSGPALEAERLHVDQSLKIGPGVVVVGGGDHAALRVAGGHIGGELSFSDAKLSSDSNSALDAERLRVDQSVTFGPGFEAMGGGDHAAVRLAGGHIGGELSFVGAKLSSSTGLALDADSLQVAQDVEMADGFESDGGGQGRVVLNFTNFRIDGTVVFNPKRLAHKSDSHSRLCLDGLTYARLPAGCSRDAWCTYLRDATPRYAAQPYQHLAEAYRAAGHDSDARKVLMAQRKDQIRRGGISRPERNWARITGFTLGYGYQPWRALLYLAASIACAVALALVLANHGALAHPATAARPATSCAAIEQVGVALNLSLPLIKVTSSSCAPTATATGQALTAAGWSLQVVAWAFATLFVAGFTSAVRKT